MVHNFTILIPYHTHPKTIGFLKRQLNYYHFNPISMIVIIAISGEEIIKNELKQFLKNLNDSRFILITNDAQNIKNVNAFIKKIYDALKLVTTSYVVLNGADDILIPQEVVKGIQILEKNLDISAVKGHTIYFNCNLGNLFFSRDLEINENYPLKRLKLAIKDRDSIFYIIRRTEDLIKEYNNIVVLSTKSNVVGDSFYHIEHFKALSVAATGKVRVFNSPWRLQSTHEYNHSAYTPAAFIRIKLGVLDKENYDWFKSVTKNMEGLSYNHYKFLWVCHQIRGISITLKQIAYNFIHKNCSLIDFIRMLAYWSLNKFYIFLQKFLPARYFGEKPQYYGSAADFIKSEHYDSLKKYYFSKENIQLLESQIN